MIDFFEYRKKFLSSRVEGFKKTKNVNIFYISMEANGNRNLIDWYKKFLPMTLPKLDN